MKINYEKPTIEFETYELNTAIASGCSTSGATVVTLGPGDEENGHGICDEYQQELEYNPGDHITTPESLNFYENSCSCYLSAGTNQLFTS